jgi:hypothetical protein
MIVDVYWMHVRHFDGSVVKWTAGDQRLVTIEDRMSTAVIAFEMDDASDIDMADDRSMHASFRSPFKALDIAILVLLLTP